MRRWVLLFLILSLVPFVHAQAETEPYTNAEFGVAFEMPAGWEVRTTIDTLLAGSPESLRILDLGGTPEELVLRIVAGSYVNLNVDNASELSTELLKLVPSGVNPPQPIETTYGNATGWEIEYTIEANNLTSRVALVSLPNGRVALIRGLAAADAWTASASAQYEALKASLEFTIPASLENPLANVPDGDGGVFWHYQAEQAAIGQTVTLGGVGYDPFSLMYIAAGLRGILVLDQTNGAFVNYLGPFFDDDNLVDLVLGIDAKIYVANASTGDNNHVMIVNRAGRYESGFGFSGDAPGEFAPGMPRTIAVTRGSDIWTVSEGHTEEPINRLYQFDRFGNLLRMIDLASINANLKNVRLDNNLSTGGLYVVGEEGGLNLLDQTGEPLVTNLGLEIFNMHKPTEVTIAPSDNIIIGTATAGFLEFAPSGALLDRFGIPYDPTRTDRFQPGEILSPAGMVVGADGMIYFAETNPNTGINQVQAFRFTGDGNLPLPNRPDSGQGTTASLGIDPAAGGGDLSYGMLVQGSLNNQYPQHEWYFEGSPGDRIRITMRDISSDQSLDTQLQLLDPNRAPLVVNDDLEGSPPEGFRASDSIIEIEIGGYGFYTIQATRFGGRGEYELKIEKMN